MVAIGETAPDFEENSSTGQAIRLSSYRGHPVIVYFYPAADTPGCTTETKGFRDLHARLDPLGVRVLGVSTDDVGSQEKFARKCSVPFPLVADTSKEIARQYGVLGPRGTARRVTFFVGPDGTVVDTVADSSAEPHLERARSRYLGTSAP